MDNILASLETVFDIDNISGKLKRLVVEASYSLSKLFVEYRWLKQFGKQKVFAQSVASRVGEAQDWQNSPAARRLLVSFCQEIRAPILEGCEEAFEELEATPDIIDQMPDATLLKIVRGRGRVLPPALQPSCIQKFLGLNSVPRIWSS
jgi:hypothetical protein